MFRISLIFFFFSFLVHVWLLQEVSTSFCFSGSAWLLSSEQLAFNSLAPSQSKPFWLSSPPRGSGSKLVLGYGQDVPNSAPFSSYISISLRLCHVLDRSSSFEITLDHHSPRNVRRNLFIVVWIFCFSLPLVEKHRHNVCLQWP